MHAFGASLDPWQRILSKEFSQPSFVFSFEKALKKWEK